MTAAGIGDLVLRVDGSEPVSPATVEAVLRANPEVITTAAITAQEAQALDQWKRWPSLTAAARDNFVSVHPDVLSRHTPRILDGAEQVCNGLEAARSRRPR